MIALEAGGLTFLTIAGLFFLAFWASHQDD
jgi:hypothetical protein